MPAEHLTLEVVIIELRKRLIDAIHRDDDSEEFHSLGYILTLIEDMAIEKGDPSVAYIALHLYEAIRDSMYFETWEDNVPTEEQIREAFL